MVWTFRFEKNKKYVIVGNSGGGKSTLLQLISGSLEDYSGSITIDGREMNTIESKSLNKLVSMIHQNVFLFDDTIKNNITLFDDSINDADIEKVIRTVGLEDLVRRIGLNGSGGEMGNFSLAEKSRG